MGIISIRKVLLLNINSKSHMTNKRHIFGPYKLQRLNADSNCMNRLNFAKKITWLNANYAMKLDTSMH